MPILPLHFEIPADCSVDQFIAELSDKTLLSPASKQQTTLTYYDSFDWRLYGANILAEFNTEEKPGDFTLKNLKTGQTFASQKLDGVPKFHWEFEKGPLRNKLESTLEMRALLPITTVKSVRHHFNILNKDEKTVLRLVIEEFDLFNNRISLVPIKGYDKALAKTVHLLEKKIGLKKIKQTILTEALKQQNKKPKSYSSKLYIQLDPEMRADIASKFIYSHLLNTIRVNEAGTIKDIDSEFLHDFRVAVRRSRSGLSQIKGVLPPEEVAKYGKYFAWLGQITGPTRDLDVYLLNFNNYKSSLPVGIRGNIEPLREFLTVKQKAAQKNLAKKLKSEKYLGLLSEWERYLKKATPKSPAEPNAMLSIKELADKRIWKVYKNVLKQGNAITDESPAESLHDLRKTCKKLRYLMEFFQSLYPEEQISRLIKTLKSFQDVLGDFQDYEIQEITLKQFSEEMMKQNVSASTFLAMGVLVQDLDRRRIGARNQFAEKFRIFKQAENQDAFKSLFAVKH